MHRKNYQPYPNATINDDYTQGDTKEAEIYANNTRYKVSYTEYHHNSQRVWNSMIIHIHDTSGKLCAEFARNYYSLSGIFVTQNGIDYFISSSDYQCITIANLHTGAVHSYTDVDDIQHGFGFCPIDFDWDDGTLSIEGCIWGFPFETMKCQDIDLENPIESFNHAEWLDE